jgi:hypothetical protein
MHSEFEPEPSGLVMLAVYLGMAIFSLAIWGAVIYLVIRVWSEL